jgi:hypothetical protein
MSCCGQKRSEQKLSSVQVPRATQVGPHRIGTPGRVRPNQARSGNNALINYLTRSSKLFNGR